MTIDERLEALAERHVALAQSIELLTHDIHEMQATTREQQVTAKLLLATAQQDGENIRALARIAELDERRITSLEGGQPG